MPIETYHIPALLKESINGLDIKPEGIYADVTFGGGGHSRAIMSALGPEGRLYGFDQDIDAQANSINDSRFTFVYSNFRFLRNFMLYYGVEHLDGIMADLGVSFHHFDSPDRGFSFRADGPLDMRMNRNATLTAAKIIDEYTVDQLTQLFRLYGELRQSRQIAQTIEKARRQAPITSTARLLDVIRPCIDPKHEKKELAQVFQALRIEVNDEMDALRQFLEQALLTLKPGGRLCVITYHSLEDRLVKNFMRSGNFDGKIETDFYGRSLAPFRLLTSKPVSPGQDEVDRNPRSRSAKLRIAQRSEKI
ncbi:MULTISPECIES: 16S rRNA (cytosine(1402)-N(4))-methyltransferase RsmH [Muribaculum]|uniref:16S rRNA (Cytosine(1402)-N(4))-methyltransferase RsmH n=1 Tax=Muribaculum caecicola TaxID=3038144 RepID=A0AC61S7Q4_9BACT|nr:MULTISPECIES: 16S rRNA (cytosine(1402)-N(4))-methyltransferase RsmH [Muribaculum]THG54941.1 16S rRNA (cytosine(1402)-N(4))-methyltransferase RsmH [Muribaculum caecicola]